MSNLKEFTVEEVKENNGSGGKPLWVIIDSKVYDVTDFTHPGGKDVYLTKFGEDRKEDFEGAHKNMYEEAKKKQIGIIKKSGFCHGGECTLGQVLLHGIGALLVIGAATAGYLIWKKNKK